MEYKFDIFADYFNFCIENEANNYPTADLIDDEFLENLVATAPGVILIGTVRDRTVPVVLEIQPALSKIEDFEESIEKWDHIAECSIEIPSGKIVILGNQYYPDAPRIEVKPDLYQARLYYSGLDTVRNNGADGDDMYRIVLQPGPYIETRVLKRRVS